MLKPSALLVAIAAVATACGGGSPSSPSPSPEPVVWSVYMAGLDVGACGVVIEGGLCGQSVRVDATGAFHEMWPAAVSTPPNLFLQADGSLTTAGFTAALKCVNTGATGSMTASPSAADYAGTATLSGRTVSILVTKRTGPCSTGPFAN